MDHINDYGQTLERVHRAPLEHMVADFAALGIDFRYLASWTDPFDDPWRYAAEIASFWGLGDDALLVVLVRYGRDWDVAGWRGAAVRKRLPDEVWLSFIRRAREGLRRHPPARVVLGLADDLLSYLRTGAVSSARRGGLSPIALAGIVVGGLYLVVRLLRLIRQLGPV